MKHVLILDDDDDLCEHLAAILHQLNYQVTSVLTVEEAYSLLEKKSFHLVLVDINLGLGKSGDDFILKARDHVPDTTFAIITGLSESLINERLQSKQLMLPVLRKPFAESDMLQFIKLLDPVS